MSRKFYVKDENGTIPASNGEGMFKVIQGKALTSFIKSNEYKEKSFYSYKKKNGDIIYIECTKEQCEKFKKEKMHQLYVHKQKEKSGLLEITLNTTVNQSDEDIEMIETILDEGAGYEKEIERKQMIEVLHKVLESLKPEEYELIYNLYLAEEPVSESQYSKNIGVPRKTINNRKLKILKKIKSFL